jgi:non-specific serine/threonine protein kinase
VGLVDMLSGMPDQARIHLERSLDIARAANLMAVEIGPLFMLSLLDYLTDDMEGALAHAEECRSIARERGNLRIRAMVAALIGNLRLELHDPAATRELLSEAVAIESQIGERVNAALILGACARLAESEGDNRRCILLASAAVQAGRSTGSGPVLLWQARVDAAVTRATAAVGKTTAATAWQRGAETGITEALGLAIHEAAPAVRSSRESARHTLTRRELEVAMLIGDGLQNRAIAERLCRSQRTVETHTENIFNKLGVGSRSEVATWAERYRTAAAHQPGEA